MRRPWDKLRKYPVEIPMVEGEWMTSSHKASVHLKCVGDYWARLYICNQLFHQDDLRELAQFATELADQLEPSGM